MTGLDITIDDNSPLISYEPFGAWVQNNSSTNSLAENFYGKTYTRTQRAGATISFTFEGFLLAIYGSKDIDHGNYTLNSDGRVRTNNSGQGTVQYPYQLYFDHGLHPGTHTVIITNQEGKPFDIDYITWTSSINQDENGTFVRLVLEDVEPAFQYQADTWSTTPSELSSFHSNTGHTTSTLGSTCNLTFAGDAVSLFGTVGPNNGPYTVQLDDRPQTAYVATRSSYTTQTLLFYGSNLGPGNHTLKIVNQANSLLEIDYAEVYTLPLFQNGTSDTTQTESLMPGATGSTHKGSNLSAGAIAGISVGAVVVMLLLVPICLCAYLGYTTQKSFRKRERSARPFKYTNEAPPRSVVPGGTTTMLPLRLSQDSKSALESSQAESPMSEMRKSAAPGFGPVTCASATSSNVSANAPMVGDDGCNVPANQGGTRVRSQSNHRTRPSSDLTQSPRSVLSPHQPPPSLSAGLPEYTLAPTGSVPHEESAQRR